MKRYNLILVFILSLVGLGFAYFVLSPPAIAAADTYTYYPDTGINNQNDLGICDDDTSGTDCSTGQLNYTLGPNQPDAGQTALNTTVFTVTAGGGGTDSITVNDCSPSSGTSDIDGSSSTITIGGYQSAVSALTSQGLTTTVVCSSATPPSGTEPAADQIINVGATINGLDKVSDITNGDTDTITATVTLEDSSGKVLKTTTTTPPTQITNSTLDLTAQFTGVTPGTYQVCLPEASPPTCATTQKVKDHIDTADVTGNASASMVTSGAAAATDSQQELQCELSILNPLTWLVCPIVAAANAAVGQLDSAINDLLNFDVGTYLGDTAVNDEGQPVNPTLPNGDTNPAPELYSAWATFRTLALSLIAIAALVMVFAQAIGSEAIDAYTVKKVLPRIFVAALVIALSWQLMKLLIQFSDDAGYGIRALIYAPFSSFPQLKVTSGTSSALALIGGGALLGLDLIGLLSFAATALVAVLVGFGLLVFRKIVLLFLIVISPIAIACFVLPNTQKLWKLWWNNFSKLLIMFPIIAGFIAIGRVFAAITYTSATGSLIDQITGIIAYFGPYFLIPVAFKMAGGIGQMAGSFAGKLGSAARKPISGFRTKKLQKHAHELKTGTRYSGKSYIPGSTAAARRFGKITQGAGMGIGKNFGLGVKGKEAKQQIGDARANEILQSKEYAAFKDNEEGNRALTYDSAQEAMAGLEERYMLMDPKLGQKGAHDKAFKAVKAAQVSGLKFGDDAVKIAAAKSLIDTGTGYEDLQDMTETLARASNGNATVGVSLAGYANYRNKQTGRWGLAPGFSQAAGLVGSRINEIKTGQGGPTDENYAAATVAAAQGTDAVTLLRQKPDDVHNLTTSLGNHYRQQWAQYQASGGTDQDALRETIKTSGLMKQLDQSKTYASPLVQNHVNTMFNEPDLVNNAGIRVGDGVRTIRSEVEKIVVGTPPPPGSPQGTLGTAPTGSQEMQDLWKQVAPRQMHDANDPRNAP